MIERILNNGQTAETINFNEYLTGIINKSLNINVLLMSRIGLIGPTIKCFPIYSLLCVLQHRLRKDAESSIFH